MADVVAGLLAELQEESADLDRLVAPLDEAGWHTATPSPGWDIADTIAHLGSTDDAAYRALTDPPGFADWLQNVVAVDVGGFLEHQVDPAREMSCADLLQWWRDGRARLVAAASAADPSERVAWFGPPMSLPSFVTARLMETWAHGQDVVDVLGADRPPTMRLRHVADISVRARKWSYTVHGVELPSTGVRVELDAPDGSVWTWGEPGEPDLVTGPALDFCLLTTQRRHRDDVALTATGPHAEEWLGIAQAYAGPPGEGRPAQASL